MNPLMQWRLAESEARRARAAHAEDRLVRAFVALDLAIRRIAFGMLHFNPSRPASSARVVRTARSRTCRS
jgi:hypothetical protein